MMLTTPKGLIKPELTDPADLRIFIGQNMDLIDELLDNVNGTAFAVIKTAEEWELENPILEEGTFGVAKDTLRIKIGDGVRSWVDLPYFTQGEKGNAPAHQWDGTSLQFENPDGTWGSLVNLKGEQGQGLVPGGTAGQILQKASSTDYDAKWVDFNPTPSWSEILNKPSTFPPSSHTHSYLPLSGGNVTGNLGITGTKAVSIGSWDSSTPSTSPVAQLVLSGAHNSGYNLGTKLLIEGYDNETQTTILRAVDENSNVDIEFKSGIGTPINYFRGNIGVGTTAPAEQVHTSEKVRADKGFVTGDFVIEYNATSKCLEFNAVG